MRARILATIFFAIAAAAAMGQNTLPAIQWRTVGEGAGSRISRAENRFLHTSGDLQRWWREHSGEPPEAIPYRIDFQKEFAIAIHIGQRPTGGYGAYVETVARTSPAAAVVAVVERQPPKGSVTTQALTQPWVLIAIQRPGVVDWQFRSRVLTEPAIPSSGGPCGCCARCKCGAAQEVFYNPTPIGSYSIDNPRGVRPLGKVPIAPYDEGPASGIRRAEAVVIQSEREFDSYWQRHRPYDEIAPDSRVDWRREQLLALHMGVPPGDGYRIEIAEIERTWYGTLLVKYAIVAPERPVGRSFQSSPFTIVRMSRITEPIQLVRRDDLARGAAKCACCDKCRK